MQLENDSIILGGLIGLFRHLKHKNLSTGDDFINSSGLIFLVPILANKETLALLAPGPIIWRRSLWSFRHLECQNPSIISDSIGIPKWLQKNAKKSEQEEEYEKEQESYSYIRGYG